MHPFSSLQGPSHSVLPQGLRILTNSSVPWAVFTWQRQRDREQVRTTVNGRGWWSHFSVFVFSVQMLFLVTRPYTSNVCKVKTHFAAETIIGYLPPGLILSFDLLSSFYLLYCSHRVSVSVHDAQVIHLGQRTLEGKNNIHRQDTAQNTPYGHRIFWTISRTIFYPVAGFATHTQVLLIY